jgi:hypothetical protein
MHDLATKGRLSYFDYNPEKEDEVVDFCKRVIEVRAAVISCLPDRREDIPALTRYHS